MNLSFKPLSNPILILNDAPDGLGGLARIGRDLASLLSTIPEFRVGYLGRGGIGKRKFPWTSYAYPESGQWGEQYIASVWSDFAGKDAGIIFSLWDLSRMLWFAQPQGLPGDLAKFLGSGRNFAKWAYTPVDSTGPDEERLPIGMQAAAQGYDRLLAASEWGAGVLQRTRSDADWMPHGIWMDKFQVKPDARVLLGWDADSVVVGCNMGNQARKDWPVAVETAMILRAEYGNKFKLWCHTDLMVGYWNLYALAADYGIGDCLEVTVDLSDEQLAQRYSACDCTILPSAGEGFGYPIAESMACGTACIATDYAAGQELVEDGCKVPPMAYRIDTQHNVRRAVLSGYGFASRAKEQIERKKEDGEWRGQEIVRRIEHLDWLKLAHPWKRWLLAGIK